MAVSAEFGLLGPLYVRCGGVTLPVTAASQRVVLAALALRTGHVVSFEELSAALWDDAPPPGARVAVRNQVSRLRHRLGSTGEHLVTRDPGYFLDAAEGDVDLLAFVRLCREGGAAVHAGAWQRASELLRNALRLWRGAPLADVPSRALRDEHVPVVDALRLQAIEWQLEAGLHMGQHDEFVAELERLVKEHPLRERFRAQLMLALYRCGRSGDALAAYRSARDVLVTELGVEPGQELRNLHQRILAADLELLPNVSPAAPGQLPATLATTVREYGPDPVVPRQLPADPPHFAGRRDELHTLSRLLSGAGQPGGTVVIVAISGTAGVGKTALAVHWAHQVAEKFPDGQLYVNLRGFDPAQPVTAAEALAGFLRALGVAGRDVPPLEAESAARYRTLLAGRRMLVVLDNAHDAGQVRPLLPGGPGCLALVTSRSQLAGLAAREGAYLLTLDLLTEVEARQLLAQRLGAARLDAEPEAATQLIRLCALLPLALAIAAARASARLQLSLGALSAELNDAGRRLDALETGDAPGSVRAVFSWSVRCLPAAPATMFRLLGLHPGPDITIPAAASLAGMPLSGARRALRELVDAHLITEHAPDRFTVHDLLRAYAAELADGQETKQSRRTALTRLFDYYLAAAAAAMDALLPAERNRRPRAPLPDTLAQPVGSAAAAEAWLGADRATLVAVACFAAEHGWPGHATRLAETLFRYLDRGGHHCDAHAVHSSALHAACQVGDRLAQADSLRHLGAGAWWQSHYAEAEDHFRRALGLYCAAGDQLGEAKTLDNLGLVLSSQGYYEQAITFRGQALAIFQQQADLLGQARTLDNLGAVLQECGRYEEAARNHEQARMLFHQLGDQIAAAMALDNLGTVLYRQGHYQQAAHHHRQAIAALGAVGHRNGKAEALDNLGCALRALGALQEAAACHQHALGLFRELGNRSGEAHALNNLGEAMTLADNDGWKLHDQALAVATQIGSRVERARAHHAIGQSLYAAGQASKAQDHLRSALILYTEIGVPDADEVQATLENISADQADLQNRHPCP